MTENTILLVDDSENIRNTYKNLIEMWGTYNVETASNGMEALARIEDTHIDLILLDLMMPQMHGYDVCSRIKSNSKYNDIKIIIFSAKSYKSDIEKAMAIGADAYVVKTEDISVLKETIENLLEKKSTFQIKFYGTRGSIATPGSNYAKYGGNTACVDIRADNELIILDAGTGIRELGLSLKKEFKEAPIKGSLLISHTHWDHIQGFPFFIAGYNPGNIFIIYGPKGTDRNLEDTFKGQFESNYFPVSLDALLAKLTFCDLTEERMRIGNINITTLYLTHPGMTLGYKLELAGKTLIYATDNELGNIDLSHDTQKFSDFINNADILIADCQYTDDEYKKQTGWGHSSLSNIINSAIRANVRNLALFHHDPMHTDEIIDGIQEDAKKIISDSNSDINIFAARESEEVTI